MRTLSFQQDLDQLECGAQRTSQGTTSADSCDGEEQRLLLQIMEGLTFPLRLSFNTLLKNLCSAACIQDIALLVVIKIIRPQVRVETCHLLIQLLIHRHRLEQHPHHCR